MKSKYLFTFLVLFTGVFLLASVDVYPLYAQSASVTTSPSTLKLSEQELADLIKPSVVYVVVYYKGDVVVKPFNFDFKEFKVVPSKDKNTKPIKIPVDKTVSGTGFVVNPDGFIITSSNVVSGETIKLVEVGPLWSEIFQDQRNCFPRQTSKHSTRRPKR